jgi:glutathione S-transferase
MYKLYGLSQSGNTFKIAFALRAMRQPWEPVFVDLMAGATRDPKWREEVNELGEVPVLEDLDGTLLTQSAAILLRLSARHGAYGGTTDLERYEVLRWLFFDNHKFTSYFATWRFMKAFGEQPPDPAVGAFLKGRIGASLAIVEKHLARQSFIVGNAPTIADMSMCAYLIFPVEEHGFDFASTHPNVAAWLDRVRHVDGFADPYEILPGNRIAPRW